jgi:alpha-galactosidase
VALVLCAVGVRAGASAVHLNRISPLAGTLMLPPEATGATALLEGYDSWESTGSAPVAIDETQRSWWTTALRARDGPTFGAQALSARRFTTSLEWQLDDAGTLNYGIWQGGAPGTDHRGPGRLALRLEPGETLETEPVLLTAADDPFALLESAARAAGRWQRRLAWPHRWRGWCSWYHFGTVVGADDVLANARAASRLGSYPLIQIDDGWQRRWGDWLPNDRFPSDLGRLVTRLGRRGQTAGLWLAPFAVDPQAPFAQAHPEALLHQSDGSLFLDPRLGKDRPMYLLDATHPAALTFLRETFARVRAWGFRYLKLDFLYGGAYEGRRHDFRATGMEALRMGLQAIGKAANPDGRRDTYLLACGAPILPVVGLFHANRTGGDTGAPTVTAEGRAGPPHLPFDWIRGVARNVAARWYQDRALYTVDPDVVMVTWPQLSDDEARVLVALCALSGGSFLLSDDLPALPRRRRALLRHPNVVALAGSRAARPIDLFQSPLAPPQVWVRRVDARTTVVGLFNWSDRAERRAWSSEHLTGRPGAHQAFDLWARIPGGRALGAPRTRFTFALRPHAVRLLKMVVRAP